MTVDALAAARDALAARDLNSLEEARLRVDVEALTRIAAGDRRAAAVCGCGRSTFA